MHDSSDWEDFKTEGSLVLRVPIPKHHVFISIPLQKYVGLPLIDNKKYWWTFSNITVQKFLD